MSAVWSVAEMFGIVPSPPNETLARSLAAWWGRPRNFACDHAKDQVWVVIAPDPSICCAEHAAQRLDNEMRCMYCHDEVDPVVDSLLVYEMQQAVTVLGRAHTECELQAAR